MPTDWTALLRELGLVTQPAATTVDPAATASLASLWTCSDGVSDRYGAEVVVTSARLAPFNAEMRDFAADLGLMSIEHLLFFGERGNGDRVFFPLIPRRDLAHEVFVWDHETDERRWVATSLENYLRATAR